MTPSRRETFEATWIQTFDYPYMDTDIRLSLYGYKHSITLIWVLTSHVVQTFDYPYMGIDPKPARNVRSHVVQTFDPDQTETQSRADGRQTQGTEGKTTPRVLRFWVYKT